MSAPPLPAVLPGGAAFRVGSDDPQAHWRYCWWNVSSSASPPGQQLTLGAVPAQGVSPPSWATPWQEASNGSLPLLQPLADGVHLLLVQAVDRGGNVDATGGVAFRWRQDTTPPLGGLFSPSGQPLRDGVVLRSFQLRKMEVWADCDTLSLTPSSGGAHSCSFDYSLSRIQESVCNSTNEVLHCSRGC